ncbi:MAG: HAD-IA family hydrolase [Pseudomonadota bacterium]
MAKAVFFESDGVMVETAKEDLAAFNTAFESVGIKTRWNEDLFARVAGTPGTKARLSAYFERFGWPLTQHGHEKLIDDLEAAHKDTMMAAARAGRLPLRPGMKALIDGAHSAGSTLAIVTEMDGDLVTTCLSQLGLSSATKLQFMVCEGSAEKSKPAPEPYRAALQIAGLPPEQAIAVEGSPAGVRSAKAAGLFVIGVGNRLFSADRLAAADHVVLDLDSEAGAAALASAVMG